LNTEEDVNRLCQLTVKFGASDAKPIRAEDIVVRDWVRLKCQYGCGGYGKCLTCPPYSPTPEEFKKVVGNYELAILLKFESKGPQRARGSSHEIVAKLERETFLSGYYSAFGLASGPCPYCDECDIKECLHPDSTRPSMEACGIDVYATVRRTGFNLKVVRNEDEKPTYFALLFLK